MGAICESGDFLAKDREMELPREGDLLAVGGQLRIDPAQAIHDDAINLMSACKTAKYARYAFGVPISKVFVR